MKHAKTVRKRSTTGSPTQHLLVADVLPLIMQRFDNVDIDNRDIKTRIAEHIELDNKVHKIVEQHKTYWTIAIKSVLGLIAGGFAVFMTWLGMR
jgi:hypothetical protein